MKTKITFKKVVGVILGTVLLAFGIALFRQARQGQDCVSALCFSLNYLINEDWSYSIFYFSVNFIFFILMIIFLREHINVGTIISLVFTGIIASAFMDLFDYIGFYPENGFLRFFIGVMGTVNIAIAIAFYGGAKLGISPYDALPLIICKYFPKMKYRYVRIAIDLSCLFIAIIIGVIILKRSGIFGIITIFSLITCGPMISGFSKIFNKYYYKDESQTFN